MKNILSLITCTALLSALPLPALAKEKKPWYEAEQPTFAGSQLGRVYANTLDIKGSDVGTVKKPQIIRAGENREATVVFDTERLMAVAAIPDRFVMFNTYRNGLGGSGNWIGAPYIFTADKEANPGQYHGLYRHGEKVLLSYTIGTLGVLEWPWCSTHQEQKIVRRHFEFSASTEPQTIWLCPESTPVKLHHADGGITLLARKGQHVLLVPPGHAGRKALVLLSDQAVPTLPNLKEVSLSQWTEGGPALWTEEIVTQGVVDTSKEGFAVDTLTLPFDNPYKALFFVGGHDFFSNGDAALCTMHGDVWRVSGIDDTLTKLTWKRYATGMFHPLGLKIVNDQVYVTCRDQLTRLHDFNGDHEADFYEAFNHEIEIGKHVHEYATGLDTDPQGNFYFVKGNNGGQSKHDGSLIRISKDGKTFEQFATGFRWPNGSGISPDGVITVADQQGTWVPSSKIDIVQRDGFYGYVPAHHREVQPTEADPPLCWIPHPIDNSCGGQTWVPKGTWGVLGGSMIHLSYGKCEAFLVLQEEVDGVAQGGVVKLPVRFQSAGMRARFSPHDQHLYVSGLKGWQTSGAKDGCFQRVRKTDDQVNLPISIAASTKGLTLRFAKKLDAELAEDPSSYSVQRWNYRWTKAYGSKDYKVSNPEEIGRDSMDVQSAKLLPDGQSVFITLNDLQPVMQMSLAYDLEDLDGDVLNGTVYHTIHALGE